MPAPPAKFGSPAHKQKISDALKKHHATKPTRALAPKPKAKPSGRHERIQNSISELQNKIKNLDRSVPKSVRLNLDQRLARLQRMLARTP